MDLITLHEDGTFDSGAQPITTATTMQEIGRLQPRSKRTLASVIVGPQAISHFQILQSAYVDDPNPQVIAADAGINSPALSDLSYVIPQLTFPLGAGTVFQLHFQGDAAEIIFQASTAGGAGATVQVKGSTNGIGTR